VDPHNRYHRGLPPKSKGDYAFITHMIETAREGTGKVGVVVPHGVLFRSAAEGKIRRKLVEENLLEAVIGLPANLFFGTSIPAAILLFNKGKTHQDVLFIDASREFREAKNQNVLTDEHVEKIVTTFRQFQTVPKYAYRASSEDIAKKDFNLNIPSYVDTFEKEAAADLPQLRREILQLEAELDEVRAKMRYYLEKLGI
jgi:type I restriction enzyme M protein